MLMRCWCFAAFLIVTSLAHASTAENPPTSIEPFLNGISGLPTIFRVDLTLAALEAEKNPPWKQHEHLLRDLYLQLGEVKSSPYPRIYAAARYDTWERIRSGAFAFTSLDVLSLRLRLLRDVANSDPSWTRTSLENLDISVPEIGCTDAMLPEVSGYYAAIGDAISSPGQPLSQADLIWLQEHSRQVHSPLQLGPLAALIAKVNANREQLIILAAAYEAALGKSTASGRELPTLVKESALEAPLLSLSERLKRSGISTTPLNESLFHFLVNSSEAPACGDAEPSRPYAEKLYREVVKGADANSKDSNFLPAQTINQGAPATNADEAVMPSEISSDSLLGRLFTLHQQAAGDSDRRDELTQQASRYADEVTAHVQAAHALQPSCLECVTFYQEKVLLGAFDLLPDGRSREALLHQVVEIMGQDSSEQDAPEVWMLHLRILLNLARPIAPSAQVQLNKMQTAGYVPFVPRSLQPEVRATLETSSNPVIAAYARADVLLNQTFDAPYLSHEGSTR